MKDVAVVAYTRTGIAKASRGALNQTHGIAMLSHVLQQAVHRAGIEPDGIEDVIVGCGLPEGATGHNVARNAALFAGFPITVPGITINRYCGSGVNAISFAATASPAASRRSSWPGASRASASCSPSSTSRASSTSLCSSACPPCGGA